MVPLFRLGSTVLLLCSLCLENEAPGSVVTVESKDGKYDFFLYC